MEADYEPCDRHPGLWHWQCFEFWARTIWGKRTNAEGTSTNPYHCGLPSAGTAKPLLSSGLPIPVEGPNATTRGRLSTLADMVCQKLTVTIMVRGEDGPLRADSVQRDIAGPRGRPAGNSRERERSWARDHHRTIGAHTGDNKAQGRTEPLGLQW